MQGSSSRLFVNDHWQAAIDYRAANGGEHSGIYGIHLGQEDLDDADLDAIRASGLRLGVSTHGYAEMLRVAAIRPSYLALGAIALRVAAWLHGHEAQSVTPADFSIAFLLVAVVGLVAIVDVFGLERDAGAHVSGHHRRKRV